MLSNIPKPSIQKIIIAFLIIIMLSFLIFTGKQPPDKMGIQDIPPTEEELKTINIFLKEETGYMSNDNPKKWDSDQSNDWYARFEYFIESIERYRMVISVQIFDDMDMVTRVYDTRYNIYGNKPISEDIYGDRSFLALKDNGGYKLVFTKEFYVVDVECPKGMSEENIKDIGKIIDNKIQI